VRSTYSLIFKLVLTRKLTRGPIELRLELLIAISVRCLITISIRYLVALHTCFLLSLFLVIVELEFVLNGLVSLEAFAYAYHFL
jgi:hypothetical protein